MNNLNSPVTIKEIKLVIKNLPQKVSPGPDCFIREFCQMFQALTQSLWKTQDHFMNLVISLMQKPGSVVC